MSEMLVRASAPPHGRAPSKCMCMPVSHSCPLQLLACCSQLLRALASLTAFRLRRPRPPCARSGATRSRSRGDRPPSAASASRLGRTSRKPSSSATGSSSSSARTRSRCARARRLRALLCRAAPRCRWCARSRPVADDTGPAVRARLRMHACTRPGGAYAATATPRAAAAARSPAPRCTARARRAAALRSAAAQDAGYEVEAGGHLITVFSAPNYCDQMGNMGALLRCAHRRSPARAASSFGRRAARPHPGFAAPGLRPSTSASTDHASPRTRACAAQVRF